MAKREKGKKAKREKWIKDQLRKKKAEAETRSEKFKEIKEKVFENMQIEEERRLETFNQKQEAKKAKEAKMKEKKTRVIRNMEQRVSVS